MAVTCRHVSQLMDAHLDGELSASLNAEVHAHLLQCPACQQMAEMMRACGNVIAQDSAVPSLSDSFATNVLGRLSLSVADQLETATTVLQTRRELRTRSWWNVARGVIPAVAAMLFFAVLIWPTPEAPTDVLGASYEKAVKDVIAPTAGVLSETQSAARSLNQFLSIPVNGTHVEQGTSSKEVKSNPPTWTDVLFLPFEDLLKPAKSKQQPTAADEVVRF